MANSVPSVVLFHVVALLVAAVRRDSNCDEWADGVAVMMMDTNAALRTAGPAPPKPGTELELSSAKAPAPIGQLQPLAPSAV